MSITFHCEYCGKKIEAPDNAGGKWGKCPSCHNKLYVPGAESGEELKLAPIDKDDQAAQKQLLDETYQLTQDILKEKESPNDSTETVRPTSASYIGDRDLVKNIILYLRQMVGGDLEQAETTLDMIVSCKDRALKILDSIALSEMPEPELADIPQQVLSGLIRTLRAKIS